jgi:hypothetical protein
MQVLSIKNQRAVTLQSTASQTLAADLNATAGSQLISEWRQKMSPSANDARQLNRLQTAVGLPTFEIPARSYPEPNDVALDVDSRDTDD